MLKRMFDLTLFIILLPIFLPLLFIISILIKLDSKGPVFFIQNRVGKDGKIFKIYKFRTLKNNSPNLHLNPQKEIKNIEKFIFPPPPENELTKIGKFLRVTSLNELPQLINVLKGDMSFVGPRPEVPEIVKLYPEEYRKRLKVKPGITGLAQVEGRSELKLDDIIRYDLEYIDNQSLLLDIKILLKTIRVVLLRKGAF